MKLRLFALACLLAVQLPQAEGFYGESDPATLMYARTVERGYLRVMGKLRPDGTQYTPDDVTNPFNISPFAPRPDGKLSWVITTLDANRSIMCIRKVVDNAEEWNAALSGLVESGLSAADATCGALPAYSLPPNAYPAPVAGIKVLDRRKVATATYVPQGIVLDGVDTTAVTTPGLVVCPAIGAGYGDIVVSNPALTQGGKSAGGHWGITQLETSPEFSATHTCNNITRNQLCVVRVAFNSAAGDNVPGSVRMFFTNGSQALVTLLGRTTTDADTGCARATATVPKTVKQL